MFGGADHQKLCTKRSRYGKIEKKERKIRKIMHEGHRERMYERLFGHGESFTDCELLETLLFNFISRKNTNPTAHTLLDCFGDVYGVFNATPRLLCAVAGIGRRTAERLYLLGAVYRRVKRDGSSFVRLYNYEETERYAAERFADCACEKLELYLLDADGALVCTKSVSNADSGKVEIDDKELSFILSEAAPKSLIVAHNHPSGKADPSPSDDESLAKIGKVCKLNGVMLRESIIFSKKGRYSYYLCGRIDEFR